MKQKLYIIGVVNTLIIFTGAIFKINHLPGAGILLSLGLAGLVLVFLPLALMNHYKSEESSKNVLLYIVTWLTCFVIFISMLFKIQHWPLAGTFLNIALVFPYAIFLPVFIGVTSKNKNFNIYNTVFILLLLALNSVFSGLLALNVSKDRIVDSYNLSRDYNKLETVLNQLPASVSNNPVNMKIDEVIKIVDEYEKQILEYGGNSMTEWQKNAGYLWFPDGRGAASSALLSYESPVGGNLLNGLQDLIKTMKNTPGYENLVKNAPMIFDFNEQTGIDRFWVINIFNDTQLAWSVIYLDGLRTNLLMIKASAAI